MEQNNGPMCESCGMPLDEDSVSKIKGTYCIYCQNQETGELGSYEQVKEGSVNASVKLMGKTPEEAEQMVNEMLPNLPRWKK